MAMIELTTAYKSSTGPNFMINTDHIVYVAPSASESQNYEGTRSYIEYIGYPEMQRAYVKESYEELKEKLKCL